MMIGMLVVGIGCLLAGLAAIGFGIPINEFGLGNTLILAGAVAACSGLIILSLWVAVRELKGAVGQLASNAAFALRNGASQRAALPRPAGTASDSVTPHADPLRAEPPGPPPSPSAPWDEEAAVRDRSGQAASSPQTSEPPAKQRRNFMFSSTSRRERERAQARPGDPSAGSGTAPEPEVNEVPPPGFDDTSPKSERARPTDVPLQRRPVRSPPPFSEPSAAIRQPPAAENKPAITVLKSGVVDGMAYSLYSDGSIEAQMPEGMMRFASIDELRAHLDQRP
nr:DUF308 domain-containing protein [Bradyrhizobium sp.]